MITRRQTFALGAAVPALSALAACGPNSSGGSGGDGGDGSLRLTWWGNPTRNEMTTQVIEAYKAVDDAVTIGAEPGEWTGYWDKLATQAAGGELPDIIQMDEKYLAEYGSRGSLLDLAEAGLDTSKFVEGSVEVGEVDGALMAINAGLNAVTMLVNPAVFEEAGVEIPDDTTWTWDDMMEIATQITEATPDGTFGMSQMGTVQGVFQVWMRQLGQDQYSADGVGFDAEAATTFLEWSQKIEDTTAGPSASVSVEDASKSMDQAMFATGKVAMQMVWSNQVVAFAAAVPGGVAVLRPPSMTGSAAEAKLWYKASMYWSVSASAQDPEAAVAFVDFLVNSVDAGKITLVERGVPGNQEVRDAIVPDLDEANTMAVTYLEDIEAELGEPPIITPPGGGEFEAILKRAAEDMLFGNATAQEAGTRLVDELTAALA